MSKHKQRRERREAYHGMLDAELDLEKPFVNRVIRAMNDRCLDIGPDGRPIKADFWRYISSRQNTAVNTARAGLCLLERAVNAVRVHHT